MCIPTYRQCTCSLMFIWSKHNENQNAGLVSRPCMFALQGEDRKVHITVHSEAKHQAKYNFIQEIGAFRFICSFCCWSCFMNISVFTCLHTHIHKHSLALPKCISAYDNLTEPYEVNMMPNWMRGGNGQLSHRFEQMRGCILCVHINTHNPYICCFSFLLFSCKFLFITLKRHFCWKCILLYEVKYCMNSHPLLCYIAGPCVVLGLGDTLPD